MGGASRAWILAAGVMHLLSKFFRGRGSFDDTAALLGFAIGTPDRGGPPVSC